MKGRFLAAALLCVFGQQVIAASFAVKEQSVTYLGTAFAGTASTGEDASSGWYNPAALTELNSSQALIAATYIKAKLRLSNGFARNNGGAITGGNEPTIPKARALVPGAFLAWKYNNRLVFGLGASAPFGLSTIYTNTDITRYFATESKLRIVAISPSIAYKINQYFSLGAAFDIARSKATLAKDINITTGEGYSIPIGSGTNYTYHLGILFKPSANTKMGLAYFGRLNPEVSGNITTHLWPASTGPVPLSFTAKVHLPERFVYSVTHKYDDKWTALADLEWTHWSRFKYVQLVFNTGRSSFEFFDYKNSYRVSFGAHYNHNQAWTFKGGVSFDQTPINTTYRSARLPDTNKTWVALGAKYRLNRNVSFDAAYAHLFINKTGLGQRSGAAVLTGNYKNSADIVGVQLTWNFV